MKEYYPNYFVSWLAKGTDLQESDLTNLEVLEPIFELNRQWVQQKEIENYTLQPDFVRAYTLFYMSMNMPKLWFLMDRGAIIPVGNEEIHFHDYGSGPGTFVWALIFYLKSKDKLKQLRSVCITEQSPVFIDQAKKLHKGLSQFLDLKHIEFTYERRDWRDSPPKQGQIAFFGNVTNELGPELATFKVENYFDQTSEIVFLEPGTSKWFHRFLPIRNQLLQKGWQIQFPCPQSQECPMLNSDNWCHMSINRFQHKLMQQMAGITGRRNHKHYFSAFHFSKNVKQSQSNWRMLSNIRRIKRSRVAWLCNGEKLKETVLNRRARSECNEAFETASIGDLLHVERSRHQPGLPKVGRLYSGDQVTNLSNGVDD
ncbi:MAG: small ribosomal subunit Rsm22 family protein [Lentisphaeria bacterium]|nr:small ribosomal subunit Rsm22 family protein [Lentisphaeria bacterium]